MIYIEDDFLDIDLINNLDNDKDEFQEVKTPGKSFWVKVPSDEFTKLVCDKISKIENTSVEPILCFFREAKERQDTDWRIHNDSIIEGQRPDRAIVLYISENNYCDLNGTAFWEHWKHGDKFENVSNEEQDRLLLEDSNDKDKWILKSVVGHKQNRLVSYPCNYFHSKYPAEFLNSRKVFVMFYKTENGK
jgi:hypothetical protein